jgi:hypothetical protein
MKLDPGIHTIKHLVFFGKSGVTVGDVELRLLQGLGEKDVEPASTVDEDLVESRARDYRLQDEWKPS